MCGWQSTENFVDQFLSTSSFQSWPLFHSLVTSCEISFLFPRESSPINVIPGCSGELSSVATLCLTFFPIISQEEFSTLFYTVSALTSYLTRMLGTVLCHVSWPGWKENFIIIYYHGATSAFPRLGTWTRNVCDQLLNDCDCFRFVEPISHTTIFKLVYVLLKSNKRPGNVNILCVLYIYRMLEMKSYLFLHTSKITGINWLAEARAS